MIKSWDQIGFSLFASESWSCIPLMNFQQKQHMKFFELLTVFLVCCRILILLLMNEIFLRSKVHTRSLNLYGCVIPVHELLKRLITSIITVIVSFKSINPVRRRALLRLDPSTVNYSDGIYWCRFFLLTPLLAVHASSRCREGAPSLPFPAPIPVSLYSHY